MASTQTTTTATVTDVALPAPLPVEVTTTVYTADALTPASGTVRVATLRVPPGVHLTDEQATEACTDVHSLLGWTS